jgi:hypothetical protein
MSYAEFIKEKQDEELRNLLDQWRGLLTVLKYMSLHAPGRAEKFDGYLKTARTKIAELEKQLT